MKPIDSKLYFFIFFLFTVAGFGQQNNTVSVSYIKKLIQNDSLEKAQKFIDDGILYYRNEKNYDSLAGFVQLVSDLKLNDNNQQKALQKAEQLTAEIKKSGKPYATKVALKEIAWIYSNIAQPQKAYSLLLEARENANKITNTKDADLASIEYSLGHSASGFGNYSLSKKHYIKSLQLLQKYKPEDYTSFQITYNALGGIMWYESKLDSATYYFEESLKALAKTDKDDLLNQYYRPALVNMNLSVLTNALGKNNEAISYVQEAVKGFGKYIKNASDEGRIFQAKKHQLVAIDNMGSFYNTIGENKRSLELIEYSYNKKKEIFEKDNINIIISLIILSEAQIANLDYESAKKNIDEAVSLLENHTDTYDYWYAAALTTKGNVYELLGDSGTAIVFYEKGEEAYRKSMSGNYAKDYLDNLIDISLFYAKNNHREKAESLALEIYDFGKNSDFKNTLQDLYHTLNLAEVYFLLKDYKKAIIYSDKVINFESNNIENTKDSILFHYRKPKAILINTQSKYHTLAKEQAVLEGLLVQVEDALGILEQRKQTVVTHEDISLLIAENSQLLDFAKKLRIELYTITRNDTYLDNTIALHESSIYNKIRSRLNLRESTQYGNIPTKIISREQTLRNNLSESLQKNEGALENFFEINRQWNDFLDSLQEQYPKYYKMKFASIESSLSDIQQQIPANSTVVRYMFIDNKLYVAVMNKDFKELIPLDYEPVKNHASAVLNHSYDSQKMSPLLHELYQALWEPFDQKINTPKVVIIPDRELFNLCFELLTPTPISSYKDLAHNSLLAKYVISYNYSLQVMYNNDKIINFDSDYVAFAPGFTSKMKKEYELAIEDSVNLDKSYLTLLPQPFSENLIKSFSKTFGGTYFLNENASKTIFTNLAGEHKIIHIATHAESNNVSPELSRLIFAKNISEIDKYDNNSLYTYEIYNINLSSELAILTACETGKPTHQPGEGMISLAHAFNYAGSESILTSLWKIDEESSAKIIASFYNYLSKGFDKDEALQKAKLDYIATAQGRTISPEYWAGLILIGDTTPINFTPNKSKYYIAGIILSLLAVLFYVKRKNSNRLLKKN